MGLAQIFKGKFFQKSSNTETQQKSTSMFFLTKFSLILQRNFQIKFKPVNFLFQKIKKKIKKSNSLLNIFPKWCELNTDKYVIYNKSTNYFHPTSKQFSHLLNYWTEKICIHASKNIELFLATAFVIKKPSIL